MTPPTTSQLAHKPQRRLILASTSPYRRQLLDRLGILYEVASPPFDEVDEPGIDPLTQIEHRAAGKAQSLAATFPDALIIGSDQGLISDGELLGKPGTQAAACAQLRRLSGRTHVLATALAILDTTTQHLQGCTECHDLSFRPLTPDEIDHYVRRELPLDCAGSFKIESLGIALFRNIQGCDPTAIIGLPLIKLITLLETVGIKPLMF